MYPPTIKDLSVVSFAPSTRQIRYIALIMMTRDPITLNDERLRQRKPSILDLSTDVLGNIFDSFRDLNIISKGSVNWGYSIQRIKNADNIARHQNVCNLRLVCRLFNEFASPLLCPVLRVELEEASLNRLEKLSQSPHLAGTVHGIQVVLHYRPKEVAMDLALYKSRRQKDLEKMIGTCDYLAETWSLGDYDENDDTICPLPHRQYVRAMKTYRSIFSAWSEASGMKVVRTIWDKEGFPNEKRIEYQQILCEGHGRYRKKHEEQLGLIVDGSFADRLAASMSRMIHVDSLGLIDTINTIPDPYFEDPTLLSTNMDHLRELMTKPHDWATIENLDGEPELLPAKLLSEVPIAIHKAGIRIRDLSLKCFPLQQNQTMVWPNRQWSFSPAWSEFHAACQSLSKFEFSMSNQPLRHENLPEDQHSAMDEYLGAILSSKSLENVRLDFHIFSVNDGRGKQRPHNVGKLLQDLRLPRINSLQIGGDATVSQSELEKFCKGLGNHLSSLYFHSIDLSDGSWAGVLDILREKVGPRSLDGRCKFTAASLTGGEFGQKQPRAILLDFLSWIPKPEPPLILKTIDYVSGVDGMTNPLRKDRE